MDRLKELIKNNFQGFTFFYRILRVRVFLVLLVSISIGILDGFGLALFLPLLQLVGGAKEASREGMGNLDFLVIYLENWGFMLNLKTILLFLVFFFTLKGIMLYLGGYYQILVRLHFLRSLRLKLLTDFNLIQFKKFVTWDIGRVQNIFTSEIGRITQGFASYFRTLNQGVLALVYAGFAILVDPAFAILVVLGGLLSNVLFSYFYKLSKIASKNLSANNSLLHGLLTQFITQFKYLRATGRNLFYSKKLEDSILSIEYENRRLGKYAAILQAGREPIIILVVASVILIQTDVIGAPLASVMVSLIFFYRALTAVNMLQISWNNYIQLSGSLDNVQVFGEELQFAKEKKKGRIHLDGFQDKIKLENIWFYYGNQGVLKNINLEIPKNQSIALVGESGSGKTTLVNLLAALFPPDKGSMTIDGKLVSELSLESYQSRVGFISQEPVVFNASIFENVTFWGEDTEENKARFYKAMKQASMLDFLEQLPEKEQTLLGNNGINLSGGQRQRIAIARELYRDIDILILDEATSALDTETERHIQDSIEQLKGHYTLITVAHRLSTVKNSDLIVMMEKGRIEYIAPFEELIIKSSKFNRMVKLQEI